MKKFNFIRSKFQQGGLPIDPLLQSSLDWYRQWYEQRKKLPQFKFTAESRLGILDRSPNVVLKPFEELNKYDAVAMYQYVPRQRGDVTSRDIIYAADPASVPGFQEAYEKRKGIKLGERMSTDLGTNPNVMMHELSHWFDSREPQTMWKPREAKGEPEYQKYPKFYFNFKNSGLDKDQYKWIGSNQKTVGNSTLKTEFNAVLNELRQQEGLKGDQPTTPEQMDIIIQKYMNLPADKLQKTNPEGTRNQRIQTLIKYLQQDPAKLSEFNNTIVKGYNPQNSIFIGKDGGLPKYQKRPGTVRNNNLSEEEKAAIMKYLQSGKRPPVVTQNRPLTPQQQTRITQKAIQRQSKPPLTQISAQDQFYQNQRQKYGRTKEDIARTQQEAAIPYLLATGAIGAAAAAPLLATVAPAIGAGLSYAPIASAPAATLGNLLSSGFASDFLLNRAPQIPSQIGRGQYGDALANTAFGALDLMGVGAINPNVINNAGRLVNQGRQYLGNTYRNISEGNNIFNYAWRSPARGIDELQARNMYRQLKNQNTLDNATKDLIGEYQYSSGSFTGRFEPAINYARRIQLEDAIDAQRIAQQQNKPTVLVRTFKPTEKELYPINESGRVIMDRPTSWSVGLGAPHSVGDRMVIKLPSGSKGLLNEYNTTKYSQDLAPLSQERELILGSGLNIGKRLGKVKNEFGGYDYIHKFRGYDPTVYDDIRRLNTENIGEIVNLNRNLATSGGFNVGVYPFLKNPNIVLKLGTTGESGMANPNDNIFFTGIPKIARDMPTSMWAMNKFPAKEIDLSGLTAQQIGRNTSKPIPNNILGSIMERTNAGNLSNISFDELANIEPWVYRTAARNINELIRKGIGVDFYGNNILFKSQNNIPEFNFIDLGPLPKSNTGVFPVGPLYALDSKALDQGVRMLDLEALKSNFKQKTRNALYDAAARSGIGSYSDQQIFDAIKKSEASIDEGLSLKKLLSLNNKQDGGPMVNPRGFMDGQPPIGSNWRIPGNTLYNPTPFKIRAVGSNGIEKTLKPFDTKRVSFGDAEYVDEYMLQKGGTAKKSRTHYIFAESPGYKPGSDLREAAKDNSFIKEALDMQSYLNKNYPDEKVVIIPGYESSDNPYTEKIKETLKESTPEDYIYLYGHHGSRYAGIPATEWGEYFKNAKYANCFLGSCSTDDLVTQQYKNVENLYVRDFDETQAPNYNTPFGRLHNFYYRPAEAWWGVNPNAPKGKDLLEGVLSAMYTTKNINRDPVLERNLINLRNTRDKVFNKYIAAYSSDPEHTKLRKEREKLWSESTKASDPKVSRKLKDEADLIFKKLKSIEDKYAIKTGYSQLNNELDRNYNKLVTSPFISNKLIPGEHYRKHDYNMLFDFERIRPLVQRPPMLLGQTESFKYGGSLSKYQVGGGLPLPGGAALRLSTLFGNLFGRNNSSPSQATSNSKITPSLQVKTVKTEDKLPYNFEQTFDKLYDEYNSKFLYERSKNDRKGFFYGADSELEKRIPLTTGRFKGANVRERILKEAVNAAKQYNVDPWLIISMMGRESTFGEGTKLNKERAGNYQALMSGWTLAEDFQPYDPLRYLADRRAPGIKVKKTPHRWIYNVVDPLALDDYLKKNTNLFQKYADKLEKTPKLGDLNSLQLAARFLKTHKVGDYNPGDPNYTRMVYDDMKVLKSDPEMSKLMKSLGYKMGGLTANKAREILHHGEVGGRKLTDKQRRFFGAMSKGNTKKY